MNTIQAIILGIVQGVTEFFPVSSSGHLVITQHIFGLTKPMLEFDVLLHMGTIVSVLIFFWKDIVAMFKKGHPMVKFIIIGSIPTFIIGALFKNAVEGFFGSSTIVGHSLIVTGIFLMIAYYHMLFNKSRYRNRNLTVNKSIMVGIAQGISVIPGISRSGATIGTSLIAGMDEDMAIKYSFLLSVPAVLGATLLKIKGIYGNLITVEAVPYFAGAVAATIAGVITIRVLYSILKKNLLYIFGVYCLVAGIVAIFFIR